MKIDFKDVLLCAGLMLASCEINGPEKAEEPVEVKNPYEEEQKTYPLYDMDSQILISVEMIENSDQYYCNNGMAIFLNGLEWHILEGWPQNTDYELAGLLDMKTNNLLNDTLSSSPAYSLHITKDSILYYQSETDPDVLCMDGRGKAKTK